MKRLFFTGTAVLWIFSTTSSQAGFFVSATPALAYSPHHQAAMARAPLDRILIETDAPVQYGDRASEPADLKETLFHLSRIKKIPEDKLADIVTKNAERFFGL